ncbi:uncharacterized protein VDAG_02797 [Verticillium dahliae VdLs.17]|uniref:Protein kinase domain-containing protein n=1 Tax=Verticillium dahliae (strain VdLs.17 / ATCC MYA-4575 / FGSC 10137) TaxID=498257 RepID=G2WX18_VERDV|nr:uncharacterized protein VDAG_02797 [Verticillium dahliae VdLs.17]EGY21273.1 hypothetical protein VDAG_02797 [Verticillium dahliae VdLs.17]
MVFADDFQRDMQEQAAVSTTRRSLQEEFESWVDRNTHKGQNCHGATQNYVPISLQRNYWTSDRVSKLLMSNQQHHMAVDQSDVVIVLKSHGGSDESESGFIYEARAYIRWHNSINESPFAISHVLKCYGIFRSYSSLPSHPYRFNILLEYADRGTLQDWYASARQPRSPVHIKSFWKSLAQILIALQALHQGLASGATR